MLINLTPPPDLEVTSIIHPNNVFSGQVINVDFTVTNTGTGPTLASSWTDRVYLSSDSIFNVGNATILGTYTHNGLLEVDSAYTQNKTVNIPQFIFGTYYIYITTDLYNQVYEHASENNNTTRSNPIDVILTPPSDLVVTNIVSVDTAANLEVVPISWTVQNQGGSAPTVGSWYDRVYLTNSPTYDLTGAVTLANVRHNGTISPGVTYNANVNVTIPASISGPYYFYVYTDIYNGVFEFTNEDNNVLRSDTTVQILNADLVVTEIVLPECDTTGDPVVIRWTTKNAGTGDINNRSWRDYIFLSHSTSYHPDSVVQLGHVYKSISLAAGDSTISQKTITLPNIAGPYYIYIYTDYQNYVFEGSAENNNVGRSDTTLCLKRPDLIATLVTAPSADSTGQPFYATWTIKNDGQAKLPHSSWSDYLYVSPQATFDTNTAILFDTLNYSDVLLIGDESVKSKEVTLPTGLNGTNYIYVYVDAKNDIFENGFDNNNITRSNAIEVTNPDLIVRHIAIPDTGNSGQPFTVDWVVKNTGNGSVLNGTWTDKILLSTSPTYDPDFIVADLGDFGYMQTLYAGDSTNLQMAVTLPNGISGSFYIYVYTDFYNDVFENTYENNNVSRSPQFTITLSPWPDLMISSLLPPDSATAGQPMSFEFSITNSGVADATGTWFDNVYISPQATWDSSGAALIGRYHRAQNLLSGLSYTVNATATLPPGLSSGDHYLYVLTDADNEVYEHTDENNNIGQSAALHISDYPIDLAVIDIFVPDSGWSGQPVTIEWNVQNISSVSTLDSSWFDAVYLSTDLNWNKNNDIFVEEWMEMGPLPAGNSYNKIKTFNLPDGVSGDYYLLLVTDHTDQNYDINLTNNYKAPTDTNGVTQITHISLTPPPDLEITAFNVPGQGSAGQPISVSWTVTNSGTGSTTAGTWLDKIYLSTDATIGASDVSIGAVTRIGDLGVAQSYSDTLDAYIPASVSGNYYVIIKTDNGNVVYEAGSEANNIEDEIIGITLPPPADLIVSDITIPDTVINGESTNIQWEIKNVGVNPASGTMRDMVYFSSDTVWDINDVLFGQYTGSINLTAQETAIRSLNADLLGVAIGDYHVLVRTDILNNINEINDDNNTGASQSTTNVDVNELPLEVLTTDTLTNFVELYYRIECTSGLVDETLLLTLKGDSIHGANEIYMSFNEMPTRANYDFAYSNPFEGNQEIIIPNLQEGTYYLLVYGSTTAGSFQTITLYPEILDFTILSIEDDQGGNTGPFTFMMIGSKFNPNMHVSLEKDYSEIHMDDLLYVDPTKV